MKRQVWIVGLLGMLLSLPVGCSSSKGDLEEIPSYPEESPDYVDIGGESIQVKGYVKKDAPPVFSATNAHLWIDATGQLYKENGSPYSYKHGKVYLEHDRQLPKEYQRAIWTPTKAIIKASEERKHLVYISRGEISVKEILPPTELEQIIGEYKNGENREYTIILLNAENRIIQQMPFTLTTK